MEQLETENTLTQPAKKKVNRNCEDNFSAENQSAESAKVCEEILTILGVYIHKIIHSSKP